MSSRVLVMNDDQSILELFQLILEPEGYEVLLSKIPFQDVSEIECLHPHLIILDFKFGTHAEGFLLLQKIRMYPPISAIPVILCTAATREVCEQEDILIQKGVPVIYKPFDLDELLQVIHRFLPASSRDERVNLT